MNIMLARQQGETDLQYHRRLVYGKLVDKTLSDVDYTELAEAIYGQPYAPDVARRMAYGSRRTLDLIAKEGLAPAQVNDIDDRIAELKIERQKLIDQRTAFNKSIREVARQQELTEIIESAVNNGALPKLEPKERIIYASDGTRDLLVSLNDLHFGAVVDNKWRKYNPDICRQMLIEYAEKVERIAVETGAINCYVWNAGDSISGSIHKSIQVTNKENVIKQTCGVSELIAEFLTSISPLFETVSYVSVAGNHSRIEANKKDALISERLDNITGWYLDARMRDVANVRIMNEATIDDTMFLLDIRGKKYCGVHGDFDTSISSVQSLKSMCERIGECDELYAVLSGHLHHNKIDSVNGVKSIMAGSFLGMDDYCIQRRICGRPEQLVCVCDNSGIVCSYDIQFSES